MFGRGVKSLDASDIFMEAMKSSRELTCRLEEMARVAEAEETAADESLRIALITNERNAGRIVEIAGPYKAFLFGDEGKDIEARVKALETAAHVGYETTEETLEAAATFAKHLSARGTVLPAHNGNSR